jgi:hypothetical protein
MLPMNRLITVQNNLNLAILGLMLNLSGFIAAGAAIKFAITMPDSMHVATFVVALAGWLPALVIGITACIALLLQRRWGIVLALVALGLQLITLVPYGIVRTVLIPESREICGVITAVVLGGGTVLIIYWSQALGKWQQCHE